MALKIGIVGLPNVGKSTLFNALTKSHAAEAANYPFCTIDPNVGIVEIPDERLIKLATLFNSKKTVPTAIEFVDIAGLVAGAAQGEGLGNKFLAHIRECDAIAHVVRDFVDTDIQHVSAEPDSANDIETIATELILADIATAEKRLVDYEKKARAGNKEAIRARDLIGKILENLRNEKISYENEIADEDERKIFHDWQLITAKPIIYTINISETDIANFDAEIFRTKINLPTSAKIVPISAKIESELIELSDTEAKIFLADLNLQESSLNRLIREAYSALDLITFFTAGEKETRAWTIKNGAYAPNAAGRIHTDFERGFICAEIVEWQKLVEAGNHAVAREHGWIRSEGKNYKMKDGDVCDFKFNV